MVGKGAFLRLSRRLMEKIIWLCAAVTVYIALFQYINPAAGIYQSAERNRLGEIQQIWTKTDEIAPVVFRSVVAAEDAKFCAHHGIDWNVIKDVLEEGGTRGASTITQQVAKNVFLWHGRGKSIYLRKALEIPIALLIDLTWSKARILEIYVNIVELDEGVFGFGAAAKHYYGVTPDKITAFQAARLAAILPAPKSRSPLKPSAFIKRKTKIVRDGAETIRIDGRASCFETG